MKKEEYSIFCPKLIIKQSELLHQLPLILPQPSLKMLPTEDKKNLNPTFCRETINIYLKKFRILLQILREKLFQRLRKCGDSLLFNEKKMMNLSTSLLTIAPKEELGVKDNFELELLFSKICFKNSKKVKVALILTLFTSRASRLGKTPSAFLDSKNQNVLTLIFSG